MTNSSVTDRIERNILINASRNRVWQCLTNAEDFGAWFGADLKGQAFVIGARTRGRMDGGCDSDDKWFDVVVERIEPQNLFSYRWHPYGVDPVADYMDAEPQPTLVTFTLTDAPGNGTLLMVVESGFDNVPPHRRLEAFRKHTGGWEAQLANVAQYAAV